MPGDVSTPSRIRCARAQFRAPLRQHCGPDRMNLSPAFISEHNRRRSEWDNRAVEQDGL